MKILYLFALLTGTVALTYAYSSTTQLDNISNDKPYEPHIYADGVVATPSKITQAFLLGLLYNAPSISR
jgi:hypothetical protein